MTDQRCPCNRNERIPATRLRLLGFQPPSQFDLSNATGLVHHLKADIPAEMMRETGCQGPNPADSDL